MDVIMVELHYLETNSENDILQYQTNITQF